MVIFKDIEGYEGLYQVSNLGNVKSLGNDKARKEKILKPVKDKDGYLQVGLHKQGKIKTYLVHRLVGQAFIENPNNYPIINHRNEIKTDNRSENLEFCDALYNANFGTRNQRIGESNSKQVLCVETGVIYPSTMEVQRRFGFANQYISAACNGKRKQAYGYTWCYV